MSKYLEKRSRVVVLLGLNFVLKYQVNYGAEKDVIDETIVEAKDPVEIK